MILVVLLLFVSCEMSNNSSNDELPVNGDAVGTWKLTFDGFSATMVFWSNGVVQYSSTSEGTNEQDKARTQTLEKTGSYTALSDAEGTISFTECYSIETVDGVVTRSSPYSESWTYELFESDGSIRIVCQDYNATITLDKK